MSAPTTHVGSIDLFVGDDCTPTAAQVMGSPGVFVARIGPVTLFGTANTLERVLVVALEELRSAARVSA